MIYTYEQHICINFIDEINYHADVQPDLWENTGTFTGKILGEYRNLQEDNWKKYRKYDFN